MSKPELTPRRTLTADDFHGTRGAAFRTAAVGAIDTEARTVELAFSSNAEVERAWGVEVLSHEPGACDLSRLADGGAVLADHDWSDQVGVVLECRIDADGKGRALVKFSRSERAQEIFDDIVDGIRKHVSVGYRVRAWALTEQRDDVDVYTITSWQPFEISMVAVPADVSVGVGRSLATQSMTPPEQPAGQQILQPTRSENTVPQEIETTVDTAAATRAGTDAERARVRSLNELAAAYNATDLVRGYIDDGKSVADFQAALLARSNTKPVSQPSFSMSDDEVREYSIVRAIRALANPQDRKAQDEAKFELEVSAAAAKRDGKTPSGIYVPVEVLSARAGEGLVSKGGATGQGSNLVATNLLASSFIDILRNRCVLMQRATPLSGLVGDIDIPRQNAASAGYWVGEGVPAGNTKPGTDKVTMRSKTVGGRTQITRKMLLQSAMSIEALVRKDLAIALATAIDLAGFYGTGANDTPLGILNTPGIKTVEFAGDVPSFAELVEMESLVAAANADIGDLAYLVHATMRGELKTAQKFQGTNGQAIWENGEVNGYSAEATNQVLPGDVFFGNYADILFGSWSGIDLIADPYSDSGAGGLFVTALQDVDLALRHGASFAHGRKGA